MLARHAKDRDGKNSPIDRLVVTLGRDNLGSQVIWSTAESPSNVGNFFGETEIGNLEMAVSVEEQVLGLQITVDDVHGMQVVESESHLGGVELSDGVGESLCIASVMFTMESAKIQT
jgi:hypothetical protein